MKIRADFVTNSSSSSFVTISITTKDGTMLEHDYSMEDIGFSESLYTLEESEILELVSEHTTVNQLLKALDDLYDGMFLDEDEENPFDGVVFEEIAEITITDQWDCDGEGGLLAIEGVPNSGEWSTTWTTDEDKDDDSDSYDDVDDE